MNETFLDATDTALLCEGGGIRSMYVAALIARLVRENVRFGWTGGCSSGAVQIANFISGDLDRIEHMADSFQPSRAREKTLLFFQNHGLLDNENLDETCAFDQDYPFNFHDFEANPTPMAISAVRADTGQTVWWDRSDIPDKVSLLKRLQATTAMPTIRSEAYIDGVAYIDGMFGSHGGLPVKRALDDGMEKLFVILTRPRNFWQRPWPQQWLIRQAMHRFPIIVEAILQRANRYNASKQRLLELEAAGKAYLFFPDSFPHKKRDVAGNVAEFYFTQGLAQTQREWPLITAFLEQKEPGIGAL